MAKVRSASTAKPACARRRAPVGAQVRHAPRPLASSRAAWQRASSPGRPRPRSSGRKRGKASISATASRPPGRERGEDPGQDAIRIGHVVQGVGRPHQVDRRRWSGQPASRSAWTVRTRPARSERREPGAGGGPACAADMSTAVTSAPAKRRASARVPVPVPAAQVQHPAGRRRRPARATQADHVGQVARAAPRRRGPGARPGRLGRLVPVRAGGRGHGVMVFHASDATSGLRYGIVSCV